MAKQYNKWKMMAVNEQESAYNYASDNQEKITQHKRSIGFYLDDKDWVDNKLNKIYEGKQEKKPISSVGEYTPQRYRPSAQHGD
jgi:hypothetical protein